MHLFLLMNSINKRAYNIVKYIELFKIFNDTIKFDMINSTIKLVLNF